jgi:hypothetical protein
MNALKAYPFLRIAALACATGLGVSGVWIAGTELLAPGLGYFPVQREETVRWEEQRGRASAAATLGHLRGDLWTVASVAHVAALDPAAKASPDAAHSHVRDAARRAARHSPHDSRAWLVLARLEADAGKDAGAELLKLSYYPGSSELSLAPLRLAVAVRTPGAADPELRSLVELDIQRVLSRRPDLKPAIGDAYRHGGPQGREIIASVLKQADPALLATLQGSP